MTSFEHLDEELEFRVYRVPTGETKPLEKDFLGSTVINLNRFVQSVTDPYIETETKKDITRSLRGIKGEAIDSKSKLIFTPKLVLAREDKHPVSLKITANCINLLKMNIHGRASHSVVALYEQDDVSLDFSVYHSQTELIQHNDNPSFLKTLIIDTYEEDELKFNVYNVSSTQVSEGDRMGSIRISVKELMKIGIFF